MAAMPAKMLQIIIEIVSRLMFSLSTDSLRKKNCLENKLGRDSLRGPMANSKQARDGGIWRRNAVVL